MLSLIDNKVISWLYFHQGNRDKLNLFLVLLLWFFSTSILYTQEDQSSVVNHQFLLVKDTIIIDDNLIVPESVIINSSDEKLSYKVEANEIRLSTTKIDSTPVSLSYRVILMDLRASEPLLDSAGINTEDRIILIEQDYTNEIDYERKLIESRNLEYSGSFSRGVSFGNTQDVVLNSNFNLQMSGDLGNGLEVRAAISDENIPIQPEGNTQVLQEFDKIFIEIKKDKTKVIAGDYELSRPESYFVNYYKKLKGLSLETTLSNSDWEVSNKGSFAVSRGKFRRIQLDVKDGNQGPYKLDGENGEIFLQVLSGTEKIYADGQLLRRGENYDYVIDYNRAEIRFTPQRIITANLRIIVEFEYAVQSYLRSLYATETKFKKGNWSFGLNFYSEQDSKSLGSNLSLDSTDVNFLRTIGDEDALKSGIFNPTEDNIDNIIPYTIENIILTYSPFDSTGVVGAVFTNLGSESGFYVIDNQASANGRVYRYEGENMGQFDPVVKLIAPEKRQMLSLSGQYHLSDSTYVKIESAMSNFDVNRFSNLDSEDDTGYAIFTQINDARRIGKSQNWVIESFLNLERSHKNFKSLNPYRDQEFIRDWNLTDSVNENQSLLNTGVKMKNQSSEIAYGLKRFENGDLYKGTIHNTELSHTNEGWNFNFENSA